MKELLEFYLELFQDGHFTKENTIRVLLSHFTTHMNAEFSIHCDSCAQCDKVKLKTTEKAFFDQSV